MESGPFQEGREHIAVNGGCTLAKFVCQSRKQRTQFYECSAYSASRGTIRELSSTLQSEIQRVGNGEKEIAVIYLSFSVSEFPTT
jgi:hypothetical protein